jgi:hypothetical protein
MGCRAPSQHTTGGALAFLVIGVGFGLWGMHRQGRKAVQEQEEREELTPSS